LSPWHWVYFVSFVLFGTFVVVNLFVAVVINSLEESHREVAESEARASGQAPSDLRHVRGLLAEADRRLATLDQDSPHRHY